MKKSTLYLVQGAVIAALYVLLTYGQEMLLPGTTSAAIQFRVSEVLTVMALFTPSAPVGLTIGCVLANIVSLGALPLDMVMGSIATLLATLCMYRLRNVQIKGIPFLALLMPALFNGIIIGAEIAIFFVDGGFTFGAFLMEGAMVALGELGVLIVLGIPFFIAIKKTRIFKRAVI